MQVGEESKNVGLEKKDAMNQARWRVEVGELIGLYIKDFVQVSALTKILSNMEVFC